MKRFRYNNPDALNISLLAWTRFVEMQHGVCQGQSITITGDCLINTITDRHESFLSAFRTEGPISADLSEVGRVDVSFVQLLVSAAKTARGQNRPFHLTGVPQPLQSTLEGVGVSIDSRSGQISLS